MAYGDTGVVFGWTNPQIRYPNKWTIIPYIGDSGVSSAAVTVYSYDEMQTEFGRMQQLAKTTGDATKKYDQIVVTTNKEVVPSVSDTGVGGDAV
jgi:hypothetical protein